MKILQVISMGYVCGGAERSVQLLREALLAGGHDVRIMASDRDPDQPHFSDYECQHIQGGPFRHLWSKSAHATLRRAIADFAPDVVHFHTMGELSPSVLFALKGTPALLTVHGPEEYTASLLEWYLAPEMFNGDVRIANLTLQGRLQYFFFKHMQRPLYKRGFRNVSAMIAPSKYMAGQLALEAYGVPVQQVYNGIPLPDMQPLPAEPTLLYVGRLERVKGVSVLVNAMPEILKQVPAARLRIVGDGPDRQRLEQLASEIGVAEHIDFAGWQKDTPHEYAAARVVVIPSIWPENLPTVAIEALAVGRPIVGSRVGGIPELITDMVSGRIVTPNDAPALASAVIGLLQHPKLFAMAEAAHKSSARFDVGDFTANLERVYQQLAKR